MNQERASLRLQGTILQREQNKTPSAALRALALARDGSLVTILPSIDETVPRTVEADVGRHIPAAGVLRCESGGLLPAARLRSRGFLFKV
jgi:hypothetical protein